VAQLHLERITNLEKCFNEEKEKVEEFNYGRSRRCHGLVGSLTPRNEVVKNKSEGFGSR
jgi:hypothetical protein